MWPFKGAFWWRSLSGQKLKPLASPSSLLWKAHRFFFLKTVKDFLITFWFFSEHKFFSFY